MIYKLWLRIGLTDDLPMSRYFYKYYWKLYRYIGLKFGYWERMSNYDGWLSELTQMKNDTLRQKVIRVGIRKGFDKKYLEELDDYLETTVNINRFS